MPNQTLPDNLLYVLEKPKGDAPSLSDYQIAFDAASKDVTSPNDASFRPILGSAGVAVAEPVLIQKLSSATAGPSLLNIAILGAIAFFGYQLFKGKMNELL